MHNPLLIILGVVTALAILAVVCGVTAHLVKRDVRQDTDRMWLEMDWAAEEIGELHAQIGELSRELGVLRGEAAASSGDHDLVDVHRHAISNLTARVNQLEDAVRMPDVPTVGPLLFAQTASDFLLPTLRVDTRPSPTPLAIGRAAASLPVDNRATGFTREHARLVVAVAGEVVEQ